jgi:uncharacterized protein YoxC
MNGTTWTVIATACGTFVVVVLQGLNIDSMSKVETKVGDVKSGVNANESDLQNLINENREAIKNQKIIIKDLEDLKDKINKANP